MIKSITVTNYVGDSIKLELSRPEKSGFAVKSISGLGPGKAIINTSEVATTDGSVFNSSRLPNRNIVISLKYLWIDSIEEARYRSYKYFPLNKTVKLLIETDTRLAEIEGYVESNEPSIFSNDSGTDISIICTDPLFYSAKEGGSNVTNFHGIEPMFEFPFSNESLTENLIEVGIIKTMVENVVTYEGGFDIGVTMTIHAVGSVSNINIYNVGTRESMFIDTDRIAALTGSGIVAGDDIIISTVKNNKSIKLIREGKTTNILNALDKNSDWFTLTRGDNVFAYTAEDGLANIQFTIEHRLAYEGV